MSVLPSREHMHAFSSSPRDFLLGSAGSQYETTHRLFLISGSILTPDPAGAATGRLEEAFVPVSSLLAGPGDCNLLLRNPGAYSRLPVLQPLAEQSTNSLTKSFLDDMRADWHGSC